MALRANFFPLLFIVHTTSAADPDPDRVVGSASLCQIQIDINSKLIIKLRNYTFFQKVSNFSKILKTPLTLMRKIKLETGNAVTYTKKFKFSIPDPEVKKAPDPGSATLASSVVIFSFFPLN
jgi:hypothetical protein